MEQTRGVPTPGEDDASKVHLLCQFKVTRNEQLIGGVRRQRGLFDRIDDEVKGSVSNDFLSAAKGLISSALTYGSFFVSIYFVQKEDLRGFVIVDNGGILTHEAVQASIESKEGNIHSAYSIADVFNVSISVGSKTEITILEKICRN